MKKYALGLLVLGLASSGVSAATLPASALEREFHACFSGLESSEQTQKCLANTHNKIKKGIQERLMALSERDRIYVLNTKILQLNVSSLGCAANVLDPVTVKSCKLTTDLHALYYLEVRYG